MNLRIFIFILVFAPYGCTLNKSADKPDSESACLQPPQYITTDTFKAVEESALSLSKKYGSENVLLVLDADNTLIVMDQDLGSDPWFNWQFSLLLTDPSSDELFFSSIQELLEAQRLLYDVSGMSPVEEFQPSMLKNLQRMGLRKIVLTSRGPEMRSATVRELERNGFAADANDLTDKLYRIFYPYDANSITESGLSFDELKKYRFIVDKPECIDAESIDPTCVLPAQAANFQDNLYMTSGQHKGFMLEYLLKNSGHLHGKSFKAILFVDDTLKNVVDIYGSFCDIGIELQLFHYTHEETSVEEFKNSDKGIVKRKWNTLKQAIESLP